MRIFYYDYMPNFYYRRECFFTVITADGLKIRRAEKGDVETIDRLLYQVNNVHSDVRPDLFKANEKKYTDEELFKIIADGQTPVFVAECGGAVVGYAFCVHLRPLGKNNMTDIKTLYIDDLCVDESMRGKHVGKSLYEYVLAYAREQGCYNVTLNVWADNEKAVGFYEKLGLKVQKMGMEKIL